jgi:membrane protease YdiL (CAAX protease family)
MVVCPGCGDERGDGDRFCGRCGRSLPTEATAVPRWKAPRPVLLLWILLLCSLGVFQLWARYEDLSSPWYDVCITLFNAAVIGWFVCGDLGALRDCLRIGAPRWGQVLRTVGAGVGLAGFMAIYFGALMRLVLPSYRLLEPFVSHGWPLWTAFVLFAVAPGILEELAFRGWIMDRLDEILGRTDGLLVQAAMFSVLHMSPAIFVSHFVFGVATGWLRRTTGSLYPCMLVHMGWNAIALLFELLSS